MSVIAAAVVTSAALGAVSTNNAASKAADAQNRATSAQQGIAERQQAIADEQWSRYKNTYGPLEDEFVQEAKDRGSQANQERAAEQAAGAVTSSYANLRQRLNSTPGLDPSSARYLDTMSKLGVSEAAQSAAAQTGAREATRSSGDAALKDAVSLGKGLPATASAALGSASGIYGAMGTAAAQQGKVAAQQGYGIGRMFGDVLTNPAVSTKINGWINGVPSAAAVPTQGAGWASGGGMGTFDGTDLGQEFSDRRLKTGINLIGVRADGLGIYSFRYVWGGRPRVGHMADEVAKVYPDAVGRHASGFLMVDYSKV